MGTASTIDIGLKDDRLAFDINSNPGLGAMVYRNSVGTGNFTSTGIQLRWNYGSQGVQYTDEVEVSVFAIEMVLVRGGSFWVGDGSSHGTLKELGSNDPFQVKETGGVISEQSPPLPGFEIWLDGLLGISRSANSATDMNSDFPTGYRGYYVMKYEISQGQYRDFLNTLTRVQQNERTATDLNQTNITNRFVMSNSVLPEHRNGLRCEAVLSPGNPVEIFCDLNNNGVKNELDDGEWIACNFLSWADGAAYMDWSGLRPLTELEYEKAGRGQAMSIVGELAWGTDNGVSSDYTLLHEGENSEEIEIDLSLSNYSPIIGNANYFATKSELFF